MFAYIQYVRDGYRKIVPVEEIKDFRPKDIKDFNPTTPVRALWRGLRDEIDASDADRYTAQVLRLGASREELEKGNQVKRISAPKLRYVSDVTSADEESETQIDPNTEGPGKASPQKQQAKTERARLQRIVATCRKNMGSGLAVDLSTEREAQQNVKMTKRKRDEMSDDDEETSGGECTVPDKLYKESIEKLAKYRRQCKEFQEENEVLKTEKAVEKAEKEKLLVEVAKLRTLNLELQEEVISAIRAISARTGAAKPALRLRDGHFASHSVRSNAAEEQLPSSGQAHAEHSPSTPPPEEATAAIQLRPSVWEHLKAQRNESMFVKNMAVAT